MNKTDIFWKWFILAGYLICLVSLALVHEPWMDELHSWVMARDMSIRELMSAMRVEGHFCLWFLILMPFAKAGLGVYWLQIISISFMLIAAWLLVFKTDFRLLTKVIILLSFPMIYSFPIVSRCYALVPPILFGIALCYRKLQQNKYLFAILVGLLAHTHVYMEGTVLAFSLVYIYDIILPKCRANKLEAKDLGPLVVIIGFVLLAFVQVARNPFNPVFFYLGDTKVIPLVVKGLKPTVSNIFKSYSILPYGLFDSGAIEIVAYSLAFIPMAVLTCIFFYSFSNAGRIIAVISIVWQLLLSIFVFVIWNQRIYITFFIFVTVYMMMNVRGKKANRLILCLCILSSIMGYSFHIHNDISMNYSSFKPLAKAIEDTVPKGEPIFSIDFGGDCVTAYLKDRGESLIPMPLDSVKRQSFYVVSDRKRYDGYDADFIYDGSDCYWNRYFLVKLTRLDNEQ